ncbi:LptA/OstA family protein [Roseitranquillus sediminis]|uniref:LptA/OstA family protein n=1 Tax=Roseitranquillus sediminis TaxID=2809051 RepID=UPI001D0C788A|nr:LptA/OstA family protein [Roseitranquillus sediminis]MBM9593782.1 lipopolysaccharide transport periplasmic protein LptA [Roseitranquillus sediminis]
MNLRALLLTMFLAGPVWGQGASVDFGVMRQDPGLPVEVTSERLEVDQNGGVAVFSGDVVVVQGEMRLTAPEVRVEYGTGDAANGGIDRMHASGGVTMTSGGEAVEGQEAIYSVTDGTITLSGDVIVTQGNSIIAGERLFVNLETGTGTMEGRVRTIFQPDQQ